MRVKKNDIVFFFFFKKIIEIKLNLKNVFILFYFNYIICLFNLLFFYRIILDLFVR